MSRLLCLLCLLCCHCHAKRANRPKGLCHSCYYTPGVRALYKSTSKYVQRGHGTDEGTREPEPTEAMPGSEGKMAALHQRLATGQQLHHRNDGHYVKDY